MYLSWLLRLCCDCLDRLAQEDDATLPGLQAVVNMCDRRISPLWLDLWKVRHSFLKSRPTLSDSTIAEFTITFHYYLTVLVRRLDAVFLKFRYAVSFSSAAPS